MVDITQAIMTLTIGHAILLILHYHNVPIVYHVTVALITHIITVVESIAMGALAQHQLVLSVTLLLKVC